MVERRGDDDVLTVFVADGAGSASNGRDGAVTAVHSAAQFVAQSLKAADFRLGPPLAMSCVEAVRAAISAQAEALQKAPRDFACTFLGVVSIAQQTLAFQIGDGAIVLDVGQGLELFAAPMTGEYANMTHFVTQSDCLDVLEHRLYPSRVHRLAAFSDGLQRLALNMAEGTPHEPFFTPFFDVLGKASPAQEDALQTQLAAFLDSPPINERTDDDKSLALAVFCEESQA